MFARVLIVAVVASLVTVVGCAVEESSATSGASSSGDVSSGGVSTGDDVTPGSAEKPKQTPMEKCVADCKKTRTSNGWCRSYCECRTGWLNGSHRECSDHASESYIDM
jgi:hypothetical protein